MVFKSRQILVLQLPHEDRTNNFQRYQENQGENQRYLKFD
ncbi:hypothetical protein LOT_1551 [Lentilactobacillus otakiensis DSM 19908 = JCM 15040]|uniref:Uncharacterized protein n=1 Tax=Lentilactobacillus otakiensis DSM 19908 = JCM 15040 TaxID=1423780 RepID=S4NSQ4_9LACO|nr:hypothetical protein LOT_1551 [Lentilactobacillus otakiensis DSM 19908 = JCM 15040]